MFTTTVCAALSAAGLAVALLTAYRRRFRRATKIAAVSLLPVGLAMAGLVTMGRKVGTAVGEWAADLVLKPTVWAGFAVLALSVVLYLASRIGAGRAPDRAGRKAARRAAQPGPKAAAPALEPTRAPARRAEPAGEDFSDIEAILKKHGI
ncbi:hypothetical protein SRB5_20670 [Streptomyces sp. RB5]|uniref:Cellulose synthase n=1 Tax=Streptomyces smaragdinus TaxID=2585196 RepID=A0A7K0CFZ5_9ACTN|nr:hypothetical protein [Streptomyces smaragdinus]MQY11942.1 hypothetical protein [Streptomyces smaragdinus]